jgi:hypothetical protein
MGLGSNKGHNIVTCQRIASQQLDKHPMIHAHNKRTNVYSSLQSISLPDRTYTHKWRYRQIEIKIK